MRKVRQIIGKTTVILLWAVFCLAVFEAGIIIFNFTPVKWYTRFNCLCGRAHFHAGEHFSPDDMLFNEIGRQEFSDEQIQIFFSIVGVTTRESSLRFMAARSILCRKEASKDARRQLG